MYTAVPSPISSLEARRIASATSLSVITWSDTASV